MFKKIMIIMAVLIIIILAVFVIFKNEAVAPALEANITTVKVHFSNNKLDPEITCVKTFPVERQIYKTQEVAFIALSELLNGPTQQETNAGYITSINEGVRINSIKIENETAYVDFNETLEASVGGSCRVAAIRWQIVNTLKEFPTIKNVVISINGRTEDILQP